MSKVVNTEGPRRPTFCLTGGKDLFLMLRDLHTSISAAWPSSCLIEEKCSFGPP